MCNFYKTVFSNNYKTAWIVFYHHLFINLLSVPFFIAGGLSLIDLLPRPAYADALKALQQGKLPSGNNPELSEKEISAALKKIKTESAEGTILGVSTYTGSPIIVPDKYINQVMLVLGTTGSGKTITLRRFYHRAIQQGYPLIIIDGKPDNANIAWIMNLAQQYHRSFYGFNCGKQNHYDPLANGGHTELKDKIISLKDQWENDYYRSIAEDYLQTTFEVLLTSKEPLDLKRVVECLNYGELQNLARKSKNENLTKRVGSLEHYNRDDITGLQAHLNILINSELGQFFERNHGTFTLSQVIEQGGIVYFALPALRFPSFSKVLGKLIINDLKAVVDRFHDQHKKIFTVFDEFSVFAGEQVLNLVNMGRGKGVHAIFGTQGLADLDKVDKTFKSQVLNCVNTLICHRLNDQESAESIASWVGTKDAFTVTAQLNLKENEATLWATVRR